ncbi:MAG: GHKL domain-containing protein [Nitrospirae bacterium]|nr:GHKL domain-containing protein [Nitrospirota bacterium]
MKLTPSSIKGRLFIWFFVFTSILLITGGIFLYFEVKGIILNSIDKTLHSKEQLITGLLHEEHGGVELELSEIILGEYSIPRSGHYYKIIMNGNVIAASPSLADEDFNLTPGAPEYYDKNINEKIYTATGPDKEPIRILHHRIEAFGKSLDVFVAESIRESIGMMNTFRYFLIILIPASILIACLGGLWITKQSLEPVKTFSSTIKTITHKNLSEKIEAGAEELSALAGSFNEMLSRLQGAFEAEKNLISDASHELKTPVSVIKAQCDVLLQKERSAAEYKEAVETIRSVSENMGRLIKDLLSLARLDSGILLPVMFKEVSLNECILKAVGLAEPLAKKKPVVIKMSLAKDILLHGDEDRLTEALLNIIENAVNYNKANGNVEISAVRDNNAVHISISDTGIGIKKEDMGRLFERFHRADTARNTEGTGLGLSIVKSIIEAHGGEVKVESELGKGSRFTISLYC